MVASLRMTIAQVHHAAADASCWDSSAHDRLVGHRPHALVELELAVIAEPCLGQAPTS
jgi:hypothetical protein